MISREARYCKGVNENTIFGNYEKVELRSYQDWETNAIKKVLKMEFEKNAKKNKKSGFSRKKNIWRSWCCEFKKKNVWLTK